MEILLNPTSSRVMESVLEGLHRCFPDWGGEAAYRWHFERVVGHRPNDIMVARDGDRFVAGSAVVYRPVILGTGRGTNVGIMASSWTLPEARGKGLFSRFIEESVTLARAKDAALLLAYVTSINASCRCLFASGAAGYPTHYLISDTSTRTPASKTKLSLIEPSEGWMEGFMSPAREHTTSCRFDYNSHQWCGQFWKRPRETMLVRVGEMGTALIEAKDDFYRLLAFSSNGCGAVDCLGPLIAWSHSHGRRFFCFSTGERWKVRALELGLHHLPGFLMTRIANDAELIRCFQGSAYPESLKPESLYDPMSPCFLGPWFIENGDRM